VGRRIRDRVRPGLHGRLVGRTLVAFVEVQVNGEVEQIDEGLFEVSGEDFALVRTEEESIRLVVATDPEVGRLVVEWVEP
jgi:hypothetical protein